MVDGDTGREGKKIECRNIWWHGVGGRRASLSDLYYLIRGLQKSLLGSDIAQNWVGGSLSSHPRQTFTLVDVNGNKTAP